MRYLLAGLVVVVGLVTLSWLQGRFDKGDKQRALQAVLLQEPEATDCRATMVSRFKGTVQVDCRDHSWRVNVVKGVIGE
ncbi:MAG: hypothetical protein HYS22_08560 [Deltaproteobacteria bacterium]|nr:hypothetical protein [Deltaproteobacteria bacterium]